MSQHSASKRGLDRRGDDTEEATYDLHAKRYHTRPLPQISQLSEPRNLAHLKDEEICFGMLKDIIIQFNHGQSMRSIAFDEVGRGNEVFASLDLQISKDRCDILAKGNLIATMNSQTHFALTSLSSAAPLKYTGILLQEQFRKTSATTTKASPATSSKLTCAISLLICGPQSIGDSLAKELSRYHLFLQHPISSPANIVYNNPQYLTMVRFSSVNGAMLPPILSEDFQLENDPAVELEHNESMDLLDIVDHLPTQLQLREADIDRRIKTPLLSHQKEAVDFALCRESAEDSKQKSLWKLESFISEDAVYRHIVTGFQTKKPEDMLGGILADGMGLGKTLTMLACIVATLADSEVFELGEFADKVMTGAPSIRTKSTLVILPSVLLVDSWIDELEKHVTPGTLSYYKYHGPDRRLPSSSPPRYHIVFSTYGTIAADSSRGGGILSHFHWYRIILDEAHVIRNQSTKQFKAVADLSASIRWCITGTPIQNSLRDLGSLVAFLRMPVLSEAAMFRKHIENSRKMVNGNSQPHYGNLKLLLGSICLRRCTSTTLKSLGVEFITRRPSLSEIERRRYDDLGIECSEKIKMAVNGNLGKGGGSSLLTAVLLLRISCNTGLLSGIHGQSTSFREENLLPDELISLLQQSNEAICVSCKSELLSLDAEDGQQNFTRHRLKCQSCSREPSTSITADEKKLGDQIQIPTTTRAATTQDIAMEDAILNDNTIQSEGIQYKMRQEVQFDTNTSSRLTTGSSDHLRYPSKIMSLLADITEHYFEDKSIIFSFWRRSLDVVEQLFREKDLNFRRVDGNIHPSERKRLITEFQSDTSVRVLLVTIGTGAVGLNNLSVASRVHILEPQWNPSVEDQAIGRVVRLGQSKKVCVIRYIMEKTIEESIETRQILKLQLALKGDLRSSGQGLTESQKRIAHLRALDKVIGSTILTRR
ncbi:hypothetical protein F4823DRAFT_633777 [Ustulina deusta]|nr:hypothetical protein F4823DRAFT_633777 [Ustulina deusta]